MRDYIYIYITRGCFLMTDDGVATKPCTYLAISNLNPILHSSGLKKSFVIVVVVVVVLQYHTVDMEEFSRSMQIWSSSGRRVSATTYNPK